MLRNYLKPEIILISLDEGLPLLTLSISENPATKDGTVLSPTNVFFDNNKDEEAQNDPDNNNTSKHFSCWD
nr:hypothetical protein [Prevotella sp.]